MRMNRNVHLLKQVRRTDMKKLEFGVTACGLGSLEVEIRRRGDRQAIEHRTVRGHSVFSLDRPPLSATYLLKIQLPVGLRAQAAQVTTHTSYYVPNSIQLYNIQEICVDS